MPIHGSSVARAVGRTACLAALALLLVRHAGAGVALRLDIDDVAGTGWRASGVRMTLDVAATGRVSAGVLVQALELPEPLGRITAVAGRCGRLVLTRRRVRCEALQLDPGDAPAGPLAGRLEYDRDSGAMDLALTGEDGTGGSVSFDGHSGEGGWRVSLRTASWSLAALAGLAGEAFPFETDGLLDLTLDARGPGSRLAGAVWQARLHGVAAANAAGTTAVEALEVELGGSAWESAEGLAFEARMAVTSGEAYQEPVYVDFGATPASLQVRGTAAGPTIGLQTLVVEQPGILVASGSALLDRDANGAWSIGQASVDVGEILLPGAYDTLFRPFLAGGDLGALETSGRAAAQLRVTDGAAASARVRLQDVSIDDRAGRLALYGLDGMLAWTVAEAPREPMSIRWSGGFFYGIPIGAGEVSLQVGPDEWSLSHPAVVPVLDGRLEIERLAVADLARGNARVVFDARLTPIDMRGLTRALGWPPMAGSLSGVIPSLSYRDGELTFGGELLANVFDGTVRVGQFRLMDPLEPDARLEADVAMRNLDLRQVTEAFSFGLITGRLDGYVRGLQLFGWQPVAFDARLYTPPDDRSAHRISQRAVDNIASLGGGGGAGALSQGFLRFFEEFRYDRMALGCRLENEVCHMSGLEPAGTGYVILKGSGLPRIDVKGYAGRVSWPTLVEQLRSVTESEGPVIE